MKVKTIHGIIEIDPPAGYDPDSWKFEIEGYLPAYKGFVASYHHGDVKDGEQNLLFGEVSNLNVNAALLLGGDNMEELTSDFHEAVERFLSELSDPSDPLSRYGIAHYTSDPAILSYYATHYGHVESPRVEPERVSFPLYVPSLGMSA
jgi:hypothetical protein